MFTSHQQFLYPSYFKLKLRWLRSLTPVTYLSKLLRIHSLAALLQLELFRIHIQKSNRFAATIMIFIDKNI
jgi:hypothetical protein